MKRKAVIFDLDGTVLDTFPGIYLSANRTLGLLGLDEADPVKFRRFIGPPLRESFQVGCGLTDPAMLDKAVPLYLTIYENEGFKHALVYPGLIGLLEKIRACDAYLAVATMKVEDIAKKLLAYHGVSQYFDEIKGSDKGYSRSKSSNILSILDNAAVEKEDAVMIGDTQGDEQAARDAGISFIRINYGYGFDVNTKDAYSLERLSGNIFECIGIDA